MSVWLWLRAAGVGAYLALFSSVAWGIVSTTGVVSRRVTRPAANTFHAAAGAAGLALLGVHVVLLVVHDYLPFDPVDVVVPWGAPYRPVAVGLGVVAMYLAVAVLVSSWAKGHMGTRSWRAVHLAATPAFVLALLHGIFAGTDTNRPWMLAIYWGTATITVFLLLVRAFTARPRRRPGGRAGVREPAPAAGDRLPLPR